MKSKSDDTFWISYADLATGTMVVFLIVAAVMMAANQKREEERAKEVKDLAEQVQIILGMRAKLADAIHTAISESTSTKVDPVTAQLVFEDADDGIKFVEGQAELADGGKRFLDRFIPQYFCALWRFEHDLCTPGCDRLDPERPNAVRRVLVTGQADLKGDFQDNHALSRDRAGNVINYALASLGNAERASLECRPHLAEVRRYAEERLYAVGAGDVEHCRDRLSGGSRLSCSEDNTEAPKARQVTFELELTGSDMTGLVDDLLELRRITQASQPDEPTEDATSVATLEQLRQQIAERCWTDRGAYHGCEALERRCRELAQRAEQPLPPHCVGFDPVVPDAAPAP
jgi:hypothetical protein